MPHHGQEIPSLVGDWRVAVAVSVLLGAIVARVCYRWRDQLCGSGTGLAFASGGYAAVGLGGWAGAILARGGRVDVGMVLVGLPIGVVLAGQVAAPLAVMDRESTAAPLAGVFVGTTMLTLVALYDTPAVLVVLYLTAGQVAVAASAMLSTAVVVGVRG